MRLYTTFAVGVFFIGCSLTHPGPDGSPSDARETAVDVRDELVVSDGMPDMIVMQDADGGIGPDVMDVTEISVVDVLDADSSMSDTAPDIVLDVADARSDSGLSDAVSDVMPDTGSDVPSDVPVDVPADVSVTPPTVEVTCAPAAVGPRALVTNGVAMRTMQTCTVTARQADLYLYGLRLVAEGTMSAYDSVGYQPMGGSLTSATLVGSVNGGVDLVATVPMLLPRDLPVQVDLKALLNRANGGPCDGVAVATGTPVRMSLEGGYVMGAWASFAGKLNIDVRTTAVAATATRVYAAGARQVGTQFQLRNAYPIITTAVTPARYMNGVEQNIFCFDQTGDPNGGPHNWRTQVFSMNTTTPIAASNVLKFDSFKLFEDSVELPGGYGVKTYVSSIVDLTVAGSGVLDMVGTFPHHIVVTTNSERSIAAGVVRHYCLRATARVLNAAMTQPVMIVMHADAFATGTTAGNESSTQEMLAGNIVPGPYLSPTGSAGRVPGVGLATDLASPTHAPGLTGPSSCDFFCNSPLADITVTLMP